MVKIPTEIKNKILLYLDLLNKNGFQIEQAYLYGSYANGNSSELSDIDLAIVSDRFEGNRILDKEKIRGLYRQIDQRLSPYPLNKSTLEDSIFVQSEIIKKGIRIL